MNSGGQIMYLPQPRSNEDVLLASEVMWRSGYSVLWVCWTHERGPTQACGPFPYDVTVYSDDYDPDDDE